MSLLSGGAGAGDLARRDVGGLAQALDEGVLLDAGEGSGDRVEPVEGVALGPGELDVREALPAARAPGGLEDLGPLSMLDTLNDARTRATGS